MDIKYVGTYVVVSDDITTGFCVANYLGDGKARKIASPDNKVHWKYIIPYNKFESNDIENSIKFNLVKDDEYETKK